MAKTTIGQRAVEEIRRKAKDEGVTLGSVYEQLEIDRKIIYNWEDGIDPRGYNIANFMRLGLDVRYILLGERTA